MQHLATNKLNNHHHYHYCCCCNNSKQKVSASLHHPVTVHSSTTLTKSTSPLRLSRATTRTVVAASSPPSDGQTTSSSAAVLRRILDSPGIHQGPACFDALSALLVQQAGFQYCFTSGFSISAARLGLPDVGLISYGEMVDQGQKITDAVSIPVIGDGDNGYGNAMNVKRTVKGYIKAGFAGIILEDQVSPKACGHTQGRKVVPIDEAVMRIKAAVDARRESGLDIVIIARTDSRQAISLDEALRRSRAFADAGADVLFIDALTSRDEMKAFCEISPLVPKMANMLEGGGKTPILSPDELEGIGYKLVAYPLSLIGVSVQAMQDALKGIRRGLIPSPGSIPSFEEIKDTLGFNKYYEEEKLYAVTKSPPPSPRGLGSDYSLTTVDRGRSYGSTEFQQDPPIEVITPEVYSGPGASASTFDGLWSRTLRIRITGKDGLEKLDVRIPAGFLDGITNIVPALVGVNLKELLDNVTEGSQGKLLDFSDRQGDRIQVFLE